MKRRGIKLIAVLMSLTMTASLAACGNAGTKTSGTDADSDAANTEKTESSEPDTQADGDDSANPVTISYATFMVGAHASASAEEEVIKAFNEQYAGKIKVEIEELPSDDAFVDKMKSLASAKSLPDVVIGKNGIRELAIENGQAVDLMPYLEEDAEWKKYVGDGSIDYNKTEDGKIYSIANQRQVSGYFYNKAMFEDVGIEPAKDWDEFMTNNQKLKDAGITPLAMMTGENAWTTNLWLAAYIGTAGEEGNEFMNTHYPDTYEKPFVVDGLAMIQDCLKNYSSPDAIGAIYANAANSFEQEQTAMIANGPWMCPDFSDPTKSTEGLDQRVGVALYPNGGMMAQYEVGYILCTADKTPEEQAAALEFLKFKTGKYAQEVFLEKAGVLPLTENVEITDSFKAENPLIADLLDLSSQATYMYGSIDNNAYESVVKEFAVIYPELVYDETTPEKMAADLSKAIELNK
jgi:raffinose/stachyose/melibiose transport system substrate-binding protein